MIRKSSFRYIDKSLFRGIDTSSGEWRFGGIVYDVSSDCSHIYSYMDNGGRTEVFEIKSKTVGQYTGVDVSQSCRTGEHALKLFEGDIIEDKWGRIFNVESHDGVFRAAITGDYRLDTIDDIEAIIIGNVHQIELYVQKKKG